MYCRMPVVIQSLQQSITILLCTKKAVYFLLFYCMVLNLLAFHSKSSVVDAKNLPSSLLKTLRHYSIDEVLASSILKSADDCIGTYSVQATPFLTPLERDAVYQTFKDLIEIQLKFTGGYPQAERKIGLFQRREEYMDIQQQEQQGDGSTVVDSDTSALTAVSILGNFVFDKPSQQDVLEAILNCGGNGGALQYNQIGDVVLLPGDKGAHLILQDNEELLRRIRGSLRQVRSVPVQVDVLPLNQVYQRPAGVKEMVVVEASTRLDAVTSGAFGLSRAKMVKLIESGAVSVAFRPVSNPALNVLAGQEISVRELGRLVLSEVALTAKNKYRVKLTKYT